MTYLSNIFMGMLLFAFMSIVTYSLAGLLPAALILGIGLLAGGIDFVRFNDEKEKN